MRHRAAHSAAELRRWHHIRWHGTSHRHEVSHRTRGLGHAMLCTLRRGGQCLLALNSRLGARCVSAPHRAGVGVVQALQQRHEGGLAAAGQPHQRHQPPRLQRQAHLHRCAGVVAHERSVKTPSTVRLRVSPSGCRDVGSSDCRRCGRPLTWLRLSTSCRVGYRKLTSLNSTCSARLQVHQTTWLSADCAPGLLQPGELGMRRAPGQRTRAAACQGRSAGLRGHRGS